MQTAAELDQHRAIHGGNLPFNIRRVPVRDDVWAFDLDTHTWSFVGILTTPVFFHDAAITEVNTARCCV